MNKFFALFAIVACAAVVSAAPATQEIEEPSEAALFETDDGETARLTGSRQLFSDFCINSRDEVKAYLKQQVNGNALKVFNTVFNTLSELSSQVGTASSQQIEEGRKMVADDALQSKQAVLNVANTVRGVAQEKLQTTFNRLLEQFNAQGLKDIASDACSNIVQQLRPQIERSFNNYKRDLQRSEGAAELNLDEIRFNNVGCVTTSRLNKVATGCSLVSTMAPMLGDMFGY